MKASEVAKISRKISKETKKSLKNSFDSDAKAQAKLFIKEMKSKLKVINKRIIEAAHKGESGITICIGIRGGGNGRYCPEVGSEEYNELLKEDRGLDLVNIEDGELKFVGEKIRNTLLADGYKVDTSIFSSISMGYIDDYGTYKSDEIGYTIYWYISWE